MSFHWNTTAMIAAIQAACPGLKVHNNGPGGDYDTDELLVEVGNGAGIFVSGFSPDTVVTNPSRHDVTHVVVSDGFDSRGGLTSHDQHMVRAYCDIRNMLGGLLNGTDVGVHNHYDEFF